MSFVVSINIPEKALSASLVPGDVNQRKQLKCGSSTFDEAYMWPNAEKQAKKATDDPFLEECHVQSTQYVNDITQKGMGNGRRNYLIIFSLLGEPKCDASNKVACKIFKFR